MLIYYRYNWCIDIITFCVIGDHHNYRPWCTWGYPLKWSICVMVYIWLKTQHVHSNILLCQSIYVIKEVVILTRAHSFSIKGEFESCICLVCICLICIYKRCHHVNNLLPRQLVLSWCKNVSRILVV